MIKVYTFSEAKALIMPLSIGDVIKNSIWDAVENFAIDAWVFLEDTSYWIALFGGLTAIVLYMCGHKGALKWVWTLVAIYVFICALGATI